jgi:hypothetical protein
MKHSAATGRCAVCEEPSSLCQCDDDPVTKLARSLALEEQAAGTVTIKRSDFILLCGRAFAWGQEQSKAAMSSESALPSYEDITGAVARGWCSPLNEHKVMDPELAFAISVQVAALLGLGKAHRQGNAT